MIPYEWSESLSCTSQLQKGASTTSSSSGSTATTIPIFSPQGNRIAAVVDKTKIVVRDVETLSVVSFMTCVDSPKYIEWSRDGSYILACMPQRSSVNVFHVQGRQEGGNEVTLTENLAGVTFATWSPWSNVALVVCDFGSRMMAWDVSSEDEDRNTRVLACPHVVGLAGVSASRDGKVLAVLTRKACKDGISLYSIGKSSDIHEWEMIGNIEIGTMSAAGMAWSPDSKTIAVWDAVYAGPRVVVVSVDGEAGRVLMDKTWDSECGLGVRIVKWSPSGGVLAIGTYDDDVIVLNTVTWKDIDTTLHHGTVLDEQKYGDMVEIFQEVQVDDDSDLTKYTDEITMPVRLPTLAKPHAKEIMPPVGTEKLLWSGTGRYIVTICQERPHIAWIWDATRMALDTVLIHKSPIRDLAWRPHALDTLYMVCGNKNVYVWADGAATCVNTCIEDDKFRGHALQWSPNGHALHACGRESYSLGFFDGIVQM